ncbi:MAG: tetratricopeptide repeat protein [Planctomycetota bacterium]
MNALCRLSRLAHASLLVVLLAGPALAANEGQGDLDKATEAKLNATALKDLDEVIRLSESALKKGLDEGNTQFANSLLASTLTQRGSIRAAVVLRVPIGDPRVEQFRKAALSDLSRSVELDPAQAQAWLGIAQLERLPGGNTEKANEALDKAIQSAGDDPEMRAKALAYRSTLAEDPKKRLADLDEAARLAPGDAAVVRARGALRADLGQLEEALGDMDRALEIEPESAPTLEAKALILARLNRYEEALGALEELQRMQPEAVGPRMQKARVLALKADPKEAVKELDVARNLDPNNVAVLLLRAALGDDPKQRMADLDEAVRLAPQNPLVWRTRGLYRAEVGNYADALTDFDKAIELESQSPEAYEAKAAVLAKMQRYDDAVGVIDQLRSMGLPDTLVQAEKARIRVLQKDYDAAIAEIDKVLADKPDSATMLLLRAGVHQDKGDSAKAIADVEQVLKSDAANVNAVRLKAAILAEEEKYDEAIKFLKEARQKVPDQAELSLQLAFLYSAANQPQQAIDTFTELLEDDPTQWAALRGRGDTLLNIGKHKEAIADYEQAITLRPDDSGILNNLAWVLATSPYDELRDGKRAVALATKACEETDFKEAHILSTLGAAYAEAGDFDKAIEWVTKGLELANEEEARSLKKELASYQEKKPFRELLTGKEKKESHDDESSADEPTTEQDKAQPADEKPAASPAEDDADRAESEATNPATEGKAKAKKGKKGGKRAKVE